MEGQTTNSSSNCQHRNDSHSEEGRNSLEEEVSYSKKARSMLQRSVESLVESLGIPRGKTQLCRHNTGCVEDILKFTAKSFLIGYSVTAAIDIVLMLLRQGKVFQKNPQVLLYALISSKNVKFAAFPALYTLIMRTLTCVVRRVYGKDNGYVSFITGFVGGLLSMIVQEKSSRSTWALFLLTRALDSFYRNQINQRRISKSSLAEITVYCLMLCFTVNIYFTEPSLNSFGLHKTWENLSCESQEDYGIRNVIQGKYNKVLSNMGVKGDDTNKYINWKRRF